MCETFVEEAFEPPLRVHDMHHVVCVSRLCVVIPRVSQCAVVCGKLFCITLICFLTNEGTLIANTLIFKPYRRTRLTRDCRGGTVRLSRRGAARDLFGLEARDVRL